MTVGGDVGNKDARNGIPSGGPNPVTGSQSTVPAYPLVIVVLLLPTVIS